MIERHWKGIAKVEESDNYIKHLLTETFPKISEMDGFIDAKILKKRVDKGVEFLVVTVWSSIESIRQFAGEQMDLAVVPTVVQKMMIEFDDKVSHFEIAWKMKN
ncbi:MAG: hypothetical protein R2747_19540 [Pyrinomonadaceae bacterium]